MAEIATFKPVRFLEEVRGEMKKVSWPTRDEAIRLTGFVIIVSLIVGIYIGIFDYIFTKLMSLVLER